MKNKIIFFLIPVTIQLIGFFFPVPVRVFFLRKILGFSIGDNVKIGRSLILVKNACIGDGVYIGDFTVIKGLDVLKMGRSSRIGKFNWITAFPSNSTKHFLEEVDRKTHLIIGEEAAITSRHIIDCTDSVTIGKYSTFAGFRSQILTHAIDIYTNRQRSYPVKIGDYCFVGTGSIFLPGSELPSYSVAAAGAVFTKKHDELYGIYGGVPATFKSKIVGDPKYFIRTKGFVN